MLIIDGPDNIGKTTLCNKLMGLANEINPFDGIEFKVSHMTRPNEGFNFFTDYKPMINIYNIQDRFHFGAIAYHDPCPYNQDQLKFIESWLYRLGSMIIIVLPASSIYYKTRLDISKRKEMFSVKTNMKAYNTYYYIVNNCLDDGMSVCYDEVIDVNLNPNGDIVSTADDPHLKAILKVWFDRVKMYNDMF